MDGTHGATVAPSRALARFAGHGGEMSHRIQELDWSTTTIGPLEQWPSCLVTTVQMMLATHFPMIVFWGESLSVIYNDAYRPIFGAKHPDVLGKPGVEAWGEVWDVIYPMLKNVFRGEASWSEDQPLFLVRNGYREECYFTWSYSPVFDENSAVAGVVTPITETTRRVLSERRLRMLRELGNKTLNVSSVKALTVLLEEVFDHNEFDVPFSLLYLLDDSGKKVVLEFASHTKELSRFPSEINLTTQGEAGFEAVVSRVMSGNLAMEVQKLAQERGPFPSAWPETPTEDALVMPLTSNQEGRLAGVVVVGVSPRRALDEDYKGFFELIANQLSRAIATARSFEETKRRAEQLAEIDRAKTVFFSNVSHEFRTPLTLMLGPLEMSMEVLGKAQDISVVRAEVERLALVRRNSMRLLRLVNSLLDFSRIEASRMEAVYEPTDLACFTRDLASLFQSTIEMAGNRFVTDVHDVGEAYVDREMWEKIVFNLLSNAFKFTFEGEIRVNLEEKDDQIVLSVVDTGVGIADAELPRVFERFHRIEGAQGRSYEGTGIGLALTQELVRLHGGTITATSKLGKGSSFMVSIPSGCAHLPQASLGRQRANRAASSGTGTAYVEEAKRWLPSKPVETPDTLEYGGAECDFSVRILLVDDSADMRHYVSGVLQRCWNVEVAEDGGKAFERLRAERFDIVVSDIMMPVLDGFGLIAKMRACPTTEHIPVILLSARAGQEAEVEGLCCGAVDYLVKPFSGKELVARVQSQLKAARQREELEVKVRERTKQLDSTIEILRLEMLQKIHKERELVEQKTKMAAFAEYQQRLKEFINTICHEIRNPLHVMFGNVDFLQGSLETLEVLCRSEQPDLSQIVAEVVKCKEYIAVLEQSCDHQKVIVDDALDYSKIEDNKIELHPVAFAVRLTMENLLKMYAPQVGQKQLRLNVQLPTEDLWLKADCFRLTQVVSNLLSNAIKFTGAGGTISLIVEVEKVSTCQCRVAVSVDDTGIGMGPEEVDQLFQSFVQAHAGISAQYGGSGLGLAISKKLVELMGGQLSVKSSKGVGSSFRFTVLAELLLATPQEEKEDELGMQVAQHLSGHGETVLVVEDMETSSNIICSYLKTGGYFWQVAENGRVALEKCKSFSFDCILMDIDMPVMNGIVATQALREQGVTTPIIGLSGFATAEQVDAAMRMGFTDYLAKPVRRNEALEMVKRYIALRPMQKQQPPADEPPRLSPYGDFHLFGPAKTPELRSHDYVGAMVAQTHHFVMIIDPDYTVITANEPAQQEFARLFGCDCRIGSNLLELLQEQPEQLTKLKGLWTPALSGKQLTLQERFADTNGIEHCYEVNVIPLCNEKGEIIGAAHLARKVTD